MKQHIQLGKQYAESKQRLLELLNSYQDKELTPYRHEKLVRKLNYTLNLVDAILAACEEG